MNDKHHIEVQPSRSSVCFSSIALIVLSCITLSAGADESFMNLKDRPEPFQALLDDKADLALFYAMDGWRILDDTSISSIEAIPTPLFNAEYYRAVRKESTGLIAALAAVLMTLSAVALTWMKTRRRPARRSPDERSAEVKRRAQLDARLQDALSVPDPPLAVEPVMQPLKAGVVVAEDEAINRMYLKRILEKAGYEVRAAADGQAALEAAAEKTWDFILMDVSMPRMDGLEATRRIRALEAERNTPRIPIIALTAHAYAEDREACAQAGMDGFLPKPFTESALWAEVSRIAETRVAGGRMTTNQPGR